MGNDYRSIKKASLLILCIVTIVLFYSLLIKGKGLKNKHDTENDDSVKTESGTGRGYQNGVRKGPSRIEKGSEHTTGLEKSQVQKQMPSYPGYDTNLSKTPYREYPSVNITNPRDFTGNQGFKVPLADIAYYDSSRKGYNLKSISLYPDKKGLPSSLLAVLRILNKKGMTPDYIHSEQYKLAYNEIDLFYPEVYIWPYFTNTEAKTHYFLFLFKRYSADNKNWKSYSKDTSDCTQFSQRIYLLMHPGEVFMEDENYFDFLFSDMENRAERKKACNKIPNIFYTIFTPYILKKQDVETVVSGHAMISFAPENDLGGLIVGEPQTGDVENFLKDIGQLLSEELTQYPLICRLGKILNIPANKGHEAEIEEIGGYFFPSALFKAPKYIYADFRQEYEADPILLGNETYYLFQTISSYLKDILNFRPNNRLAFIDSIEKYDLYENLSPYQIENEIESCVDIIMHSLIDLENIDLRRVKSEIGDLKDFAHRQPAIPSHIKRYITALDHFFQLRLDPLLE